MFMVMAEYYPSGQVRFGQLVKKSQIEILNEID